MANRLTHLIDQPSRLLPTVVSPPQTAAECIDVICVAKALQRSEIEFQCRQDAAGFRPLGALAGSRRSANQKIWIINGAVCRRHSGDQSSSVNDIAAALGHDSRCVHGMWLERRQHQRTSGHPLSGIKRLARNSVFAAWPVPAATPLPGARRGGWSPALSTGTGGSSGLRGRIPPPSLQ